MGEPFDDGARGAPERRVARRRDPLYFEDKEENVMRNDTGEDVQRGGEYGAFESCADVGAHMCPPRVGCGLRHAGKRAPVGDFVEEALGFGGSLAVRYFDFSLFGEEELLAMGAVVIDGFQVSRVSGLRVEQSEELGGGELAFDREGGVVYGPARQGEIGAEFRGSAGEEALYCLLECSARLVF